MCSLPGYDASSRVDDLATHLNRHITSIAIGSSEGFEQVEIQIRLVTSIVFGFFPIPCLFGLYFL